jgi:hypothetical protein
MGTLTVKLSVQLEQTLEAAASREGISKSEIVRRALSAYSGKAESHSEISALDKLADLVGCFEGGPDDLSSNPEHLRGFGSR